MSLIPICSICQDSICKNLGGHDNNDTENYPVTTLCGHFYHMLCIKSWLDSSTSASPNHLNRNYGNRCPYCNKQICPYTGLIRVYPVTETDNVIPAQNTPGELGEAVDQICLISKRNDELAEENEALGKVLLSAETEKANLQKELNEVRAELEKTVRKQAYLDQTLQEVRRLLFIDQEDQEVETVPGQVESDLANLQLEPNGSKPTTVGVVEPKLPMNLPSAASEAPANLANFSVQSDGFDLVAVQTAVEAEMPSPESQLPTCLATQPDEPAPVVDDVVRVLFPPEVPFGEPQPPFQVGQPVVWEGLRGQVKCLLQDMATKIIFVGVEFHKPPAEGMSGYIDEEYIFPCEKGHGLILQASTLLMSNSINTATELANSLPCFEPKISPSGIALLDKFQLENRVLCFGIIKCRLVDLTTSDVFLGLEFSFDFQNWDGRLGGVQLFPFLPNHALFIRAKDLAPNLI